jgi:Zn-dependent peptidase ImmA (M78 family)
VSARRRTEIERLATQLLRKQGIASPPTDVQRLAESLGYRVVFKFFDDDDLSGTVFRDATNTIMLGINTLHAPVRQRFSIAHEIGHARLHLDKLNREELFVDPPARALFRDGAASLGEDRREIEANQFAAALLMPADLVGSVGSELIRVRPQLTVSEVVDALAKRFQVSSQAMRFRLVTLGVIEPN